MNKYYKPKPIPGIIQDDWSYSRDGELAIDRLGVLVAPHNLECRYVAENPKRFDNPVGDYYRTIQLLMLAGY